MKMHILISVFILMLKFRILRASILVRYFYQNLPNAVQSFVHLAIDLQSRLFCKDFPCEMRFFLLQSSEENNPSSFWLLGVVNKETEYNFQVPFSN
jgi:hypothetical protein